MLCDVISSFCSFTCICACMQKESMCEQCKVAGVGVRVAHIVEAQHIMHSMHKPIIELLSTEFGLAVGLRKVLQVRQTPSEKHHSCMI